jgi:uncharacterized integral membrane protein
MTDKAASEKRIAISGTIGLMLVLIYIMANVPTVQTSPLALWIVFAMLGLYEDFIK